MRKRDTKNKKTVSTFLKAKKLFGKSDREREREKHRDFS